MLERSQERAAGVDRVVEAARLQREQERQVRVLRRDLPRLGGEASGLGDGRRVPGASALDERERLPRSPPTTSAAATTASRARRRRARRCAVSQLAVLGVPARLQELAFDPGELPLDRRCSSTAAARRVPR